MIGCHSWIGNCPHAPTAESTRILRAHTVSNEIPAPGGAGDHRRARLGGEGGQAEPDSPALPVLGILSP